METTTASLRAQAERTLDPLLQQSDRCALLDFPSSANVGDNAIWLGESAYLRSRRMKPVYQCDRETYSEAALRRRLGDGIIFLHGGGNLGDVWEGSQDLREEVISTFGGNRIVIMPQTIHFRESSNLVRAQKTFEAHRDLTIVARSRQSFDFATHHFRTRVRLAPDMAFCMDPIQRTTSASVPVLWLGRTDQEAAGYQVPEVAGVKRVDWVELGGLRQLSVSMSRSSRLGTVAGIAKRAIRYGMRAASSGIGQTFDRRARNRLRRGVSLLSEGNVVVTDRLHGHVLSLMMGIPHVLLDNNYGKVRDFYETWTARDELVHWASSPQEALDMALDLAG